MQRPVNSVPSQRGVNSLFAYKMNFASQRLLLLLLLLLILLRLLFLSLLREATRKESRRLVAMTRGSKGFTGAFFLVVPDKITHPRDGRSYEYVSTHESKKNPTGGKNHGLRSRRHTDEERKKGRRERLLTSIASSDPEILLYPLSLSTFHFLSLFLSFPLPFLKNSTASSRQTNARVTGV